MRIDIDGSLKFYKSRKLQFLIFVGTIFLFSLAMIFHSGTLERNRILITVSLSLIAVILLVQIFMLKVYPLIHITNGGIKVRGWPYLAWDDIKGISSVGENYFGPGVKITLQEDSKIRMRLKNEESLFIRNYYFERGDKSSFIDEVIKRIQSEQETDKYLSEAYAYDNQEEQQ